MDMHPRVTDATAETPETIQKIPLGQIYCSPHQMRKHFDPVKLKELARSMKQEGLIQPIAVRRVGGAFELIAGERRFRAAQQLGWKAIESRVIDISDEDVAIKGLIENLQRADLSPIEEARGYQQLAKPPYKMTQEAIAQRVGKSQTAIARALALLDLPQEIQALMPRGIITECHTRSLRKIEDKSVQIRLATQADKAGWTVKEMERQVQAHLKQTGKPLLQHTRKAPSTDPFAQLWKAFQAGASPESDNWSVRYEGNGVWNLRVHALSPDPKTTLSNFFIRLGQTLAGPVPSDLVNKPRSS